MQQRRINCPACMHRPFATRSGRFFAYLILAAGLHVPGDGPHVLGLQLALGAEPDERRHLYVEYVHINAGT